MYYAQQGAFEKAHRYLTQAHEDVLTSRFHAWNAPIVSWAEAHLAATEER